MKCFVPACKNRSDFQCWRKRGAVVKVSFHRFPKHPDTRSLWLNLLGIRKLEIPTRACICSMHFEETIFDRQGSYVRLKKNALPLKTLNEEGTSSSEVNENNMDTLSPNTTQGLIPNSEEVESIAGTSKMSDYCPLSPEPSTSNKEDKGTMVSPTFVYNSPEKVRLRERVNFVTSESRIRLACAQRQLRRIENKVVLLKSVINDLKSKELLNSDQAIMLNMLGGAGGEIFNCLYKKNNASVSKTHNAKIRCFALTLHYYSPRAYEYVREQFNNCLPHQKTMSAWYRTLNGEPGISLEAMRSISDRVKNTKDQLIGSLMFDEVAIREHIEYDGSKFSGYIDFGKDIACEHEIVAREALVFMLVCVNGHWKIPIAYYLARGVSACDKTNLLVQCLKALHETGLKVVSVTCDGTSTNFSVFTKLGCNFNNLSNLQTSFPHPISNEKVAAFFDPCHMLKLVRNTFGDMGALIDGENQIIRWSYLNKLHDLQQQEGMHLANKVRSAHINYIKQKMKVRLAAQIFSISTANSLTFCRNLGLKEFEDCEGTVKFLLMFNDIFDILNSKNMNQPRFKQALNSNNIELIRNKFDEFKLYIMNLKYESGELIIHSRRRTGFLGFLICIESALLLFEEICVKSKFLKYIPFYKCSQDHIELLFSCIRHHGGSNNNPTARQFKAAMKKILVHADVRAAKTSNCISLEEISILHVSSAATLKKSEDIINSTSRLSRMHESEGNEFNITDELIDHDYLPNVLEITEFSKNIVEYIAGYVVMKLKLNLLCEICINALSAENNVNSFSLINIKNRGKLTQPADDVIIICRACESEIRYASRKDNMLQKPLMQLEIMNRVLRRFINSNIFNKLRSHNNDQGLMETHTAHLIRLIAKRYIKIRLHYVAINRIDKANSQRTFLNKLTLFRGQ